MVIYVAAEGEHLNKTRIATECNTENTWTDIFTADMKTVLIAVIIGVAIIILLIIIIAIVK